MMIIPKTKLKSSDIKRAISGLILWILLMMSGGFLYAIRITHVAIPIVLFFVMIAYMFVFRRKILRRTIIFLIACYGYMFFIYMLHPTSVFANQCLNVLLLLTAVFFFNSQFASSRQFMELYVDVMYWVCLYSLVIHGLNSIFNLTANAPYRYYVKTAEGNNLFVLWMGQNIRYTTRNFGPFWEPGVFQIFISIALTFALLYLADKKQTKYAAVFIVTMLTTISTTGYILMAGILMWRLLCTVREVKSGKVRFFVWWCVPILLLVGAAILISTPAVADKFQDDNFSYLRRMEDLEAMGPIIARSGPFGSGGARSGERLMAENGIMNNGKSNSISYSGVAASYGWVTLAAFILVTFRNTRKDFHAHWLLLAGIFIVSWATELLMLTPLFYFFFVGFRAGDGIDTVKGRASPVYNSKAMLAQ